MKRAMKKSTDSDPPREKTVGQVIPFTPAKKDCRVSPILSFSNKISNFSTFNVRTFKDNWRRFELIAYCIKHNIHAMALQEHKIVYNDKDTPYKSIDYGRGWTFIFSTADVNSKNSPVGGVGFILSPLAIKSLSSVESISSRIMKCTFSSTSVAKIHLFSVYSPTSVADVNQIHQFYNPLSDCCSSILERDFQIVMGDFNAQFLPIVHSQFTPENYFKPVNLKLNRNTEIFAEFLSSQDFIPINSRFRKPLKRLYTHARTTGQKVAIDHILFKSKWKSSAINCNSFIAPISSDHRPLVVSCKWRLKVHKIQHRRATYYNWRSLRNTQNNEQFNTALASIQVNPDLPPDAQYKSLVSSINNTVKEHIPSFTRVKKNCYWEDKEIITLRQEKTIARHAHASLKSNETFNVFCSASKKLADLYTAKQIAFFESNCNKVNELNGDQKYSEAWKLINIISGRSVKKKGIVAAESPQAGVKLFHLHFKKLLSPDSSADISEVPSVTEIFPPDFMFDIPFNISEISGEELNAAAKQLSSGKATGIDEVCAEVLKFDSVQNQLLPFFNHALTNGVAFSDWQISLIVPVPKSGDLSNPTNYRGIALMSIIAKLYNRILLNRIKATLDKYLRFNQNGFRSNRSTAQHILALHRLLEGSLTRANQDLIAIFIDFSKAFDSVKWTYIEAILAAYAVPPLLINAIMALYRGASATVSTQFGLSPESIDLSVGVLQGDTLAPYLFIIVIDYVMRTALDDKSSLGFQYERTADSSHRFASNPKSVYRTRNKTGARARASAEYNDVFSDKYITDLDFADDLTILAPNYINAQILFHAVERIALKVGLRINRAKTKFIAIGSSVTVAPIPKLYYLDSEDSIEQVSDFKFLGNYLFDIKSEINRRVDLAWDAARKCRRIWKTPIFPTKLKRNLFQSTVESVLLYGAETWTLTKTLMNRLEGSYNKLFRYALDIKFTERITNAEIFKDFPPLHVRLQARRLQFAGHCYRSSQSAPQPISDLIFWIPKSSFRPGQNNRLTYVKLLIQDLGLSETDIPGSVSLIKDMMANRVEWRKKIKSTCARAHKDYLSQEACKRQRRILKRQAGTS
jgi:exonuclease III